MSKKEESSSAVRTLYAPGFTVNGTMETFGRSLAVVEAEATVRRKWECSRYSVYFEEIYQLKRKK